VIAVTHSPVVVTFTDDWRRLAAYREHLDIGFPVRRRRPRPLRPARRRARSIRKVWSPGTLAMYGRLLLRGRRLHAPTEDTRQLGADAVVGRDGRLHRVWLPESPDARPPIAAMIDAVRALDD
jgi:hypothetical protein